jgi:hypothetical protein
MAHLRRLDRRAVEGVTMRLRGTDPVYPEPAVRRRYVDFLRICGALCPA